MLVGPNAWVRRAPGSGELKVMLELGAEAEFTAKADACAAMPADVTYTSPPIRPSRTFENGELPSSVCVAVPVAAAVPTIPPAPDGELVVVAQFWLPPRTSASSWEMRARQSL